MPVAGGETVAKNIISFNNTFLNHVNKTMVKAKDILDKQVTFNMSHQDHNLAYLRKMGHPYASRHGAQGIPIHDPYWAVHKQSGELLSSKESGIEEASVIGATLKASAFVKLNEAVAPHALHVIWGTSKMIPRDFLTGSLYEIKDTANEIIKSNLAHMIFNFRGVETK